MENKTCPKCGSDMQENKHLQTFGSELEPVSRNGFLGDKTFSYLASPLLEQASKIACGSERKSI
jgi:hypothetical protein